MKPLIIFVTTCCALLAGMFACGGPHTGRANDPVTLLAQGDTVGAIDRLKGFDLDKLDDPELFMLLGRLHRTRGTIVDRLQAQHTLERGLQLHPGHSGILMELAKTYFAQTFFPDAKRCFENVLRIDQDMCEAHYYLGLYHYQTWKRVNEYVDDLEVARRHFERMVECDSTKLDATLHYAFTLYALDRPISARRFCDRVIAMFPECAELRLLSGALAYDEELYPEAAREFEAGLGLLDEEERRAYGDIVAFLPYAERARYRRGNDGKRERSNRGYWIAHDPDPTTLMNERYLEHIYRTFLADLFFSNIRPSLRGWETERGQALIKFGWPSQIQSTLGGSWKDGRTETWSYLRHGAFFEFQFVDEFLNGNLRIPYRADYMVSVLRYTPLATDYLPDAVSIPGTMDIISFRNDDLTSSVLVAARIDSDSLSNSVNLDAVNHFHLRTSMFDDDWVAEHRLSDTLWTSEVTENQRRHHTYLDIIRTIEVPFDLYHFALVFADEFGLASSVLKADADTYRYMGSNLVLSDILLRDPRLEARAHRGQLGAVIRKGRVLHPNTGRIYYHSERLTVYFEIYNLTTSAQASRYELTFSIYDTPPEQPGPWTMLGRKIAGLVRLGDKDPFIAQTVQRNGTGYESVEELAINIDSLDDGPYELVISVTDQLTGERSESSVQFFKMRDAPRTQ